MFVSAPNLAIHSFSCFFCFFFSNNLFLIFEWRAPAAGDGAAGERWYGHVLDPRTGLPIAGTLQATVVAPDAATADAAATAALVLPPDDARDLLLREGLSGFLVTADHSTLRVGWPPLPHATGASTTAG